MKLRLPHRFHAALLAAIASVSFTTLSTGTIGAAVFALAGYQAAGEETETATAASGQQDLSGDFEAAKEAANQELTKAAGPTDEEREAEDKLKEELEDNARMAKEKEDEQKRETTTDPMDEEAMERTLDSINSSGGGSGSLLSMLGSAPAETETAAPVAAPAQQGTTAATGTLPSNDLGFTSNPYATASSGASEPVFQMPAAAPQAQSVETPALQTAAAPAATASPAGTVPTLGTAFNKWDSFPSFQRGYLTTTILTASDPTHLVWRGNDYGQPIWLDGGTTDASPWVTYDEGGSGGGVQTAFHNGDIAQFEYSAEVTVQGTVQTSSLQIAGGSATVPYIELTITTPKDATLTADRVVNLGNPGDNYTYKIVKKGEGQIDLNINDPSFNTTLDIQEGIANITFKNANSTNLYQNIQGSTSSTVILNFENDFKTEANVEFSGIDKYNVANGVKLQIDSDTHAGGGFYLDGTNATIQLNNKSMLDANEAIVQTKQLTIKGGTDSEAWITGQMYLDHGEGVAVHNLSDSVYVNINELVVESQSTTMQIDDASSLVIYTVYAGHDSADQTFLHAYQNDNLGGDRQSITIDVLSVGNGTVHLGAASSSQGASDVYQEAGTVKVGYIMGNGTVVLENNAEVKTDGQNLTEVFEIETANTGWGAFTGTLRLAAANSGTDTQRKKVVALFRSIGTTYDGSTPLELKADADYTDYAFVINNDLGMSCNGIKDVTAVKDNSTAMIYSGSIGDEKNAAIVSDDTTRKLEMFAAGGMDYQSSFGVSKNVDIKLTGAGKQTFSGSFKDFNGDVWVGGDSSSGTLSIIAQETAVTIQDLTIRQQAVLNVKGTEDENQLAKVSGVLTAMGSSTSSGDGESSVMHGNLQMESGSTYNVSAADGIGGLNLTGSLTFNQGAQLSSADMQAIKDYLEVDAGKNSMYDLAFNVTSFNGKTEAIDWNSPNAIDASTIFTGQFWKGEYYICFSGTGKDGGYGNNVGTVYLYYALPEPTTGTLSLLALAALAARRRRK